jgi:signal transduction histidine kinase
MTSNMPEAALTWRAITRKSLVYFVPAFILLAITLGYIYSVDASSELATIEANEQTRIEVLSEVISSDFNAVVSDLILVADDVDLARWLADDGSASRADVAQHFLSMSENTGLFDQIRYIDETGMEVVRVNYNNGDPEIVPDDQLQNKAGRYYFEDTNGLNAGEIFVSPFDLNMENGEIEQPLKPMIRFGTPVFDSDGERRGIVLVNYFGENLIDNLQWVAADANSQFMLLNEDGYWLVGLEAADEWGFMYEDARQALTFDNRYEEAWEQIASADAGQFRQDHLFTYEAIYPLEEVQRFVTTTDLDVETSQDVNEYRWSLVSFLPATQLSPWEVGGLQSYLLLGAVLAVGLMMISGGLGWTTLRSEIAEAEVRRHRDNLEELVKERTHELEKTNRDYQYANEEMRNFTSIVSHDMRSPIASIRGFMREIHLDWEELTPVLDKVVEDDRARLTYQQRLPEAFDLIDSSVAQMNRLANGIISLSREGRRVLSPEPINTVVFVQDILNTFAHMTRTNDITIDVAAALPTVKTDRLALEQIFSNLIGNAIKYLDPSRPCEIEISGVAIDDKVTFHVKDNGLGIDEDQYDNIFRLYRRGNVKEVEGDGAGLYYTRALVRRLGGNIQFNSVAGVGTTFSFTIIQNLQIEEKDNQETYYA